MAMLDQRIGDIDGSQSRTHDEDWCFVFDNTKLLHRPRASEVAHIADELVMRMSTVIAQRQHNIRGAQLSAIRQYSFGCLILAGSVDDIPMDRAKVDIQSLGIDNGFLQELSQVSAVFAPGGEVDLSKLWIIILKPAYEFHRIDRAEDHCAGMRIDDGAGLNASELV